MEHEDKYITIQEIAIRMKVCYRTAREFFIKERRIPYMKIGRSYLILKKAFEEWEKENMTKVARKW